MKHFYIIASLIGLIVSAVFFAIRGVTSIDYSAGWYVLLVATLAIFVGVCLQASDNSK